MKIVKPSATLYFHIPFTGEENWMVGKPIQPTHFLERVARKCYKSEDAICEGSDIKLLTKLQKLKHGAMLEHVFATADFTIDRGVSHEAVRHRLASFAQVSTRYVNYSKDKFRNEISVIEPPGLNINQKQVWEDSCRIAEDSYMRLIESGAPPQIARSVLPTCTATELLITANIREWQHILTLRTSTAAHPQIKEVMDIVLNKLMKVFPILFKEIWEGVSNEKSES